MPVHLGKLLKMTHMLALLAPRGPGLDSSHLEREAAEDLLSSPSLSLCEYVYVSHSVFKSIY